MCVRVRVSKTTCIEDLLAAPKGKLPPDDSIEVCVYVCVYACQIECNIVLLCFDTWYLYAHATYTIALCLHSSFKT